MKIKKSNKKKGNEAKFIIVILLVFLTIFFISSAYNNYKAKSEINNIVHSLVNGEEIDEQSLEIIMNKDYKELRKETGMDQEFLIYFEDEQGKPLKINGMYCFGYDGIARECR